MGILMSPLPPPDQDTSTSGRTGKYMVIKRLLPLFEQYAPQQAAELRVAMNAIATQSDVAQGEGNRAIDRGITPDDPSGDPIKSLQDRIDHAKTSEERDGIYADTAAAIAGKGDPQSHELANLYVAGCGIFPTESSANPTFALNALALRGAEQLAANWGAIAS